LWWWWWSNSSTLLEYNNKTRLRWIDMPVSFHACRETCAR
jgi:hypothetical protein